MHRLLSVTAVVFFTIMAVYVPSEAVAAKDASEYQYEVLSPWAEVDPIPLRGISPRLDTLAGKKKLKEKFPTIQTTLFDSRLPNVTETETVNKEKFAAWAKEMDAVVAMVGD